MKISARASFSGGSRKYFPQRSIAARPTHRATTYMIAEPNQEPSVPATTTPKSVIPESPCVAATIAAGGITTSLGIGTMVLSKAISQKTAAYPPVWTQLNHCSIN